LRAAAGLRLAMLAINVVLIAAVAVAASPQFLSRFPARPAVSRPRSACFVVSMLAGLGLFSAPAVAVDDATAAIASDDTPEAGPDCRSRRCGAGRDRSHPAAAPRPSDGPWNEPTGRRVCAIGALAARLDVPEHRLRQAINEGLGYRNFNAFLNRYRIEDGEGRTVRCDATGGPGADHRHGCRLPVDRTVQSRLQGRDRRDPDRIPARGADPAGNRLRSGISQPRREIG
jgi:hypothetical protein